MVMVLLSTAIGLISAVLVAGTMVERHRANRARPSAGVCETCGVATPDAECEECYYARQW